MNARVSHGQIFALYSHVTLIMNRMSAYRIAWIAPIAVLILVLNQACQEELPTPGVPTSARAWVEASARYHDPSSLWLTFKGRFEVETQFPSGGGYSNSLYLDRARDTFSRTIISAGYPLVQVVGPSGCSATWPNPDATETELRRNGLLEDPCDYILYRRDFYEFLMGIPMVALESDISFRQNPDLVNAFGTDCVEIELTFPTGSLTWYFYISATTYRLEAAKFINSRGNGEWLSYEDDVEHQGFLLKKSQRWYELDAVTEIVNDAIEWGR